jgi:SulP family sulfate permease
MAYAMLAGVAPVCGLYTAIVMTALGSVFGSSAHLINGPTNAISLLVFGIISGVGSGPDDPTRIGLVAWLAVLAGSLQIVLSLLKLGGLSRHVPEAVVPGFMAGAGLLVALAQIPGILGLRQIGDGEDHVLYRLWLTLSLGGPAHIGSLAIGLGTAVLVVALQRLGRRIRVRIPEMFVSLVVVSLLVALAGPELGDEGLGRLHVESGFPRPALPVPLPGWERQLHSIAGGAVAIALLGLVEALATAKALAVRSGQPLDCDRQCLAEGLANFGGGLFGCMPGSGSLSRSAINFYAGAATRLSGIIAAATVAITVWLFAPLARFVPQSALAGILLCTAWHIVDPRRLLECLLLSPSDAAVALSTAMATIFGRMEFAPLVGLATFLFCRALPVSRRVSQRMVRGGCRANPCRYEGARAVVTELSHISAYFEGQR